MQIGSRLFVVGGLAISLCTPASAGLFYSTLSEIISSESNPRQQTFSNAGGPPQSAVVGVGTGTVGSQAHARVAPGKIETWTNGKYDSLRVSAAGVESAVDGFIQARGLGYTNDFLTIDAAAPSGFLQVALTYNNDSFFETNFTSTKPAQIVSLYDIYYKFWAGSIGSEQQFVDYNRRTVAISFSSGFGFTIDERLSEYLAGKFVSGQVFLVPFDTSELLSIEMIGDCTGTADIDDFGSARAGCGSNQLFGWGGILGAQDADGNPIALRSVTSASGADYLTNLSGLDFEPVFGVPEPAIWVQFILGFGLAGGFARRRRAMIA